MKAPPKYRYIPFYDLLADAVFQHQLASQAIDSYAMNRYARTSILSSVLSVECAANCLLYSLEIPASLHSELDKLPTITKVETCLKFKGINTFNRGSNEVQKVRELIKVRNDYVHPKITKINAAIGLPQDAGTEWMIPMSLDGEHWSAVGIPKRAMFWSKESSLSALLAIASFFSYLFVDCLKASQTELQGMLKSGLEFSNVRVLAIYDECKNELKGAKVHGVDFSFLGIFEDEKEN